MPEEQENPKFGAGFYIKSHVTAQVVMMDGGTIEIREGRENGDENCI